MTSVDCRTNKLKTFKFDIQAFSQEDFNERGFVQPWRIALFHQYIRTAGVRVTMKDQLLIFFQNHTMFIRHQKVNIDEMICTTDLLLSQPVYGLYSVLYCGNSSMLFETKIILENQQTCISTCRVQPVCVSRENRKPAPFPDAIMEIYSYAALEPKPEITPMLTAPQSSHQQSYSQKFTIGETDIDSNGHTNNTMYIKFCVYVASKAITNRIFPHVTHDILNSKLREFTVQYVGETVKGDEITFTSWQDLRNEYLLHFEAKKDDNVVCRCQLNFNSQIQSSL